MTDAPPRKKRGMSIQVRALLAFALICGLVFMSTMLLFVVGMLPTLVATFIDKNAEKTRGLTVGALNFAGCMPFMLQLWTTDHSVENAVDMLTDPRTIIVMYSAAGVGYVVDWAVSGLVASVMVQTSAARLQTIAKRRVELIERWGREVTGEIAVDRQGFPIEPDLAAGNNDIKPGKTR